MKHKTKKKISVTMLMSKVNRNEDGGLSDKRIKIGALSKKVQESAMPPIVLRVLEKYGPTYL